LFHRSSENSFKSKIMLERVAKREWGWDGGLDGSSGFMGKILFECRVVIQQM